MCHAGRPRLGEVQLDRIHQLDVVAALGQPHRVRAGAAADVEHARGRRWQEPLEQLLGADELEPAPAAQPPLLVAAVVVVADLWIHCRPARYPVMRKAECVDVAGMTSPRAELTSAIARADRGYDKCRQRLAAFDQRAAARVRGLVAAGQVRPGLTWLSSDERAGAATR